MSVLTDELEQRIEDATGLYITVEDDGEKLVLSGMVSNVGERNAAWETASRLAEGRIIDDNIEVSGELPSQYQVEDLESAGAVGQETWGEDNRGPIESIEPGDFTDQRLQKSPQRAAGPENSIYKDEVSEGDYAYVPPIDPVVDGNEVIGGLQIDALESVEVARSSLDGEPGDEALRDAILRELREDAATTSLEIDVKVDRRVAYLRGRVTDIEDAENVEAVAASVPGLTEVIEQLDVRDMN